MESSHKKFTVLSGLALALLVGLVVLVFGHIRNLEQRVSELGEAKRVLERSLEHAETTVATTRSDKADVEAELTELQKPQAVSGPANFPISRVLAQRNDTVIALAKRQRTTPDVIYALNPWLGGEGALTVGQAIWIPNGED